MCSVTLSNRPITYFIKKQLHASKDHIVNNVTSSLYKELGYSQMICHRIFLRNKYMYFLLYHFLTNLKQLFPFAITNGFRQQENEYHWKIFQRCKRNNFQNHILLVKPKIQECKRYLSSSKFKIKAHNIYCML